MNTRLFRISNNSYVPFKISECKTFSGVASQHGFTLNFMRLFYGSLNTIAAVVFCLLFCRYTRSRQTIAPQVLHVRALAGSSPNQKSPPPPPPPSPPPLRPQPRFLIAKLLRLNTSHRLAYKRASNQHLKVGSVWLGTPECLPNAL